MFHALKPRLFSRLLVQMGGGSHVAVHTSGEGAIKVPLPLRRTLKFTA